MAAEDIQGVPELPEVPSIPIFPSKEIGTRPRLPGERRTPDAAPKRILDEDRVELSNESRAFNASRVLFDRIAVEFQRRQSDGEPALPVLDAAKIEDELLSRGTTGPEAAADALLSEIRGQARALGSGVDTQEFRQFQRTARDAFETAFDGTRSELAEAEQLDEPTEVQLSATAQRVYAGIEALTPF